MFLTFTTVLLGWEREPVKQDSNSVHKVWFASSTEHADEKLLKKFCPHSLMTVVDLRRLMIIVAHQSNLSSKTLFKNNCFTFK